MTVPSNTVCVPTVEMLPEGVDGNAVIFDVMALDTAVLGTLSASDDFSVWLPIMADGVYGPLVGSLEEGSRWLLRAMNGFRDLEVTACPEPGCALLAEYDGRCMGLDGREWKG